MASIQIQLHATPEDIPEICDLVRSASEHVRFYAWTPEDGLIQVDTSEALPNGAMQLIAVARAIQGQGQNQLEVLDENPGALVISVPYVEGNELREIDISAKALDAEGAGQVAIWGKAIRKLRKRLVSGARVTNPNTGAAQYYKNAHATPRAIQASNSGTRLIAPGGNVFEYTTA